jgi:multidrug resistance protein MdtO
VKDALQEMQTVFARNLEMFAELTEQLLEKDQVKAIRRIRQLRDQLNAGFQAVSAQADAVLFEFGPARQRKLQIRDDIRRWQPTIRTLLQVQIASVQYLAHKPLSNLPEPVAQAGVTFEKDIALVMHAMANEVKTFRGGARHPHLGYAAARGDSQLLPGTRRSRSRSGIRCIGPRREPRHDSCAAIRRHPHNLRGP